METHCEELVNLTMQARNQVPAEAEAEVLEELEEDMDHREEMVEALGRALKDVVPGGLKDQMEKGHEGISSSGSERQAVRGSRKGSARL
jgi:hypothetical protein